MKPGIATSRENLHAEHIIHFKIPQEFKDGPDNDIELALRINQA